MPEGCNFMCCQRPASYNWYGYCTEAHYKRGIRDPEEKERVEKRQLDEMMAFFKLMEEPKETKPKETKPQETKPQETKPQERQRSKSC